jgi:fatty acid desaturase
MVQSLKKTEPFMALLLVITAFFAGREVFPLSLYYLLALIVGFYFFPARLMIRKDRDSDNRKREAEFFIASFTISMIIFVSIPVMFLPGQNVFRTLLIVVSFLNIGFFYYNMRSREYYRDAILHMCVIIISSVILFT